MIVLYWKMNLEWSEEEKKSPCIVSSIERIIVVVVFYSFTEERNKQASTKSSLLIKTNWIFFSIFISVDGISGISWCVNLEKSSTTQIILTVLIVCPRRSSALCCFVVDCCFVCVFEIENFPSNHWHQVVPQPLQSSFYHRISLKAGKIENIKKATKMAPVRGDGMRGLAVFISDIRNCEYLKYWFYK